MREQGRERHRKISIDKQRDRERDFGEGVKKGINKWCLGNEKEN